MKVREIMSHDPSCCRPETSLQEVASLMRDRDCGEIPVVENEESASPIGVITDRDIVCRALARGENPLDLTAEDVMTKTVISVTPETSLEECCDIMEKTILNFRK